MHQFLDAVVHVFPAIGIQVRLGFRFFNAFAQWQRFHLAGLQRVWLPVCGFHQRHAGR